VVRFLLLLFIAIPVAEMWLLIQVGGVIGAWPTIALVLLTAMVGLTLLRRQGFETLMRGRAKMESGEIPAMEMIEGLVLAVSGAMLLTPGFFTDAIGFAGLLPVTRRMLIGFLINRMNVVNGYYQTSNFQTHTIDGNTQSDGNTQRQKNTHDKEPLEGEYRRED
jgi:UPF0716 protein FxsA